MEPDSEKPSTPPADEWRPLKRLGASWLSAVEVLFNPLSVIWIGLTVGLHPCSVKTSDLEGGGSERATSSVLIGLATTFEKEETPWPEDSLSESARS